MNHELSNPGIAHEMAARQRDISVSEFFLKNRHLLGFDSPSKAALTTVKETVDNALDACEEAGILPEIWVEFANLGDGVLQVVVEDNGPGIVEEQIARIFGKLLYGSKFHKLSQSRGQQGMGISAAGMYAQLTTGKPLHVFSRVQEESTATEMFVSINTAKNRPEIHKKKRVSWDRPHGTRLEAEIEGQFHKGNHSIGDDQLLAGLRKEFDADFFTTTTRPPAVYRGNPFQIEVSLAYGHAAGTHFELSEHGHLQKMTRPRSNTTPDQKVWPDDHVQLLRLDNVLQEKRSL